jgi:hypothetical protein
MEMTNIYLGYLDNHKKSGYILGTFSLPNGIPAYFIATTIIFAAFVQYYLPLYHLPFILSLFICWDLRVVLEIRNSVLETCILEESFFSTCLEMEGGDPYFPEDPAYVVESDRISIFNDAIKQQIKVPFLQRLKSHYVYLICIVALYIGFYSVIQFILHNLG